MKIKLSFRMRLLLSHIFPVLILVPLVGLALIYFLETRLILPTLANEMMGQGMLLERLLRDMPEVWESPAVAQTLLDSVDFREPSRTGLLTPQKVLLATSRPDDLPLVGQTIQNLPDDDVLLKTWWDVTPGDTSDEQILDVIIPVKQNTGQVVGFIRIYRRITDIDQKFSNMRLLILGVLLGGLLITVAVAIFLSESINRTLKIFSRTIAESPLEGKAVRLPEDKNSEFTELSHVYNRLQERREELEETRQQLLANLVHEIGRPLGSLRTALHALQAGAVNDLELRSDLMKGMSERVERMGRLLEDLALTYRGLEIQEIEKKSLQINEWLESLIPLWAENARQKQLVWETILPEDLPLIQTDPDRLAQALGNLVNNAIKFTSAGGKITLRTEIKGCLVEFQVIDNGIGIPLDDQRHLFVPFYRSVQPSWKAPGLGLGLSIAKSICESLGGTISLVSSSSQGSTFTITLPIF